MISEIIKVREIEYGTIRDLIGLFYRHGVYGANNFISYKKDLQFRRRGRRKVEIVSLKIAEAEKLYGEEAFEFVSEIFRKRRMRPATLWEVTAILPQYDNWEELENFLVEFGQSPTLFAFGWRLEPFVGPVPAAIYFSRRRVFSYVFQISAVTQNVWYLGYRYV